MSRQCRLVRLAFPRRPSDRRNLSNAARCLCGGARPTRTTPGHLLSDSLDDFNHYITARIDGELVGFISITPPGFGKYSIDKYIARDVGGSV